VKLVTLRDQAQASVQRVAVFGSGLVGGALMDALATRGAVAAVETLPYDWNDAEARAAQTARILAALTRPEVARIDIVWAAGRSGFGSTPQDMTTETAHVAEILELARAVAAACPEAQLGIHLVSSAGGLFEGQLFCGAQAQPTPQRAYGFGKLDQEAQLAALEDIAQLRVYRPSSIYGFQAGGRLGLISALALNGLSGRETTIVGRPDTMRDYVLAEDVGRFIVIQILNPTPDAWAAYLLATGRPSAMFEIIQRMEDILQRPLLLRYDTTPSNAQHMSFRTSALDPRWRPVNLETGMRHTVSQIKMSLLKRSA